MRSLKLAVAMVMAAWLAGSFAQQGAPAGDPPANRPPPATPAPPSPAPAPEPEEREAPQADEPDDVFVPTEELQPDAAVTFPVDI